MAEHGSHHVVPIRVYLGVFVALLVLTWATVAVAYVDLGRYNVLVALSIAVAKMTLVLLFFMHLKYGPRLNWVVAGASFGWLLILFAFTMSDFLTRTTVTSQAF